ncbi:unnamed protein product [Dovyalis caffra]|uniref:Transposase n=1 Tax=Dovyalis caffra TaxID=77055 RepID=A0AAV1QXS5_9ROSI|nr:unnamed protein product [Dovyalis caffra]
MGEKRPMIRKTYHKKSSADTLRETRKVDAEEVRNNKSQIGEIDSNSWVPHERTGIYYPKGQEKVMEGIPPGAGKDVNVVNWKGLKVIKTPTNPITFRMKNNMWAPAFEDQLSSSRKRKGQVDS